MSTVFSLKDLTRRIKLEAIKLDPQNARSHNERNLESIKNSLIEHGQVEPLIIRKANNRLIGGEGRWRAMRELGWTEAEAVVLDIPAKAARKLAIRLNRTAELAEWNFEHLVDNFREIGESFDFSLLGFEPHEVEPLLKASWTPPEIVDLPTKKGQKHSPIALSDEERQAIDKAIGKCQTLQGVKLGDGAALKIICEFYLNNVRAGKGKKA
ncbi:MAG: ParB N-terminal domain-containing protein [Acidobacteria bacterium]|nr:ParB N-terminal domain-containing protein [Acidobacteriota bacterium]